MSEVEKIKIPSEMALYKSLLEKLKEQQYVISTPPILVSTLRSGYNLPVRIGMRYVPRGLLLGLFEDRTTIVIPENRDEKTGLVLRPIGYMNIDEDDANNFTCWNGYINIMWAEQNLKPDKYFGEIYQMIGQAKLAGIAISPNETYGQRQASAKEKLNIKFQKPTPNRKIQLQQPVDQRRGLASFLIHLGIVITQENGGEYFHLRNCNDDMQQMITHAYPQAIPSTYTPFRPGAKKETSYTIFANNVKSE